MHGLWKKNRKILKQENHTETLISNLLIPLPSPRSFFFSINDNMEKRKKTIYHKYVNLFISLDLFIHFSIAKSFYGDLNFLGFILSIWEISFTMISISRISFKIFLLFSYSKNEKLFIRHWYSIIHPFFFRNWAMGSKIRN